MQIIPKMFIQREINITLNILKQIQVFQSTIKPLGGVLNFEWETHEKLDERFLGLHLGGPTWFGDQFTQLKTRLLKTQLKKVAFDAVANPSWSPSLIAKRKTPAKTLALRSWLFKFMIAWYFLCFCFTYSNLNLKFSTSHFDPKILGAERRHWRAT